MTRGVINDEQVASPIKILTSDNLHLSQARIDARGGARLELSTPSPGDLQADALLDRMRAYAEASRATNTWRAYQSDLRHFAAWCAEHDISEPVPAAPTAVAAYLTDYAGVESQASRVESRESSVESQASLVGCRSSGVARRVSRPECYTRPRRPARCSARSRPALRT